ncbi:phage-related hypothetical protein [Rhodovulum sp. P5]|uniref:minor tail protein n=1 Tax=Rhodovulum phage vB_RhkS_P1 TaxID=1873452 RepID=UPI00080A9733|nr:DUF1833 family protein [Rhodovulum sp. P5]YP_009285934.1 minor tail protein [Rhodovulum phage vB_RhkS_P1]ANT39920.1 hypothetical protein Rhks_49 [Rhodovulum phage vB_RhkS_P1]ARE38988.1 phage-related hypothetical protein [Rhodovulum sp. P5]
MSRPLSNAALAAIHAQETGAVLVVLASLSHGDWAAPLRLANNTDQDVTHLGQIYTPAAFRVALPDDDDEAIPQVSWQLDNVQRDVLAQLRATSGVIDVTLTWVLASQPDTVEAEIAAQIGGVQYDALTISGAMTVEPLLERRFARHAFTPGLFPGLFS